MTVTYELENVLCMTCGRDDGGGVQLNEQWLCLACWSERPPATSREVAGEEVLYKDSRVGETRMSVSRLRRRSACLTRFLSIS